MAKRVIYYRDELNDDFAATRDKIHVKEVDSDYRYLRKNPLWKAASFLLHKVVAALVGYVLCKFKYGMRIKNRKALRKIKTGYFFYGNHTQNIADAFLPTLLAYPRKTYIITGRETVSIPIVKRLVPMMGALPLPSTIGGMKNLMESLKTVTEKKCVTAIYPEAHIWPYYNGIRPFTDRSFTYPARLGVPAVGFTVTYRKRRVFKKLPPPITVYVGEPVYPEEGKPVSFNRAKLRQGVYDFMVDTIEKHGSAEYIEYRKVQ